MRRTLTLGLSLAFTSTLLVVAPATAHTPDDPAHTAECPAPVMVEHYDADEFAVAASLPASGCAAREQRQFPLWLSVTRFDETTAHGTTRGQLCGPFRPSSGPDGPVYSCDIDLILDHPEVEEAYYEVEVIYPGPDGEETLRYDLFCVSDQGGAACDLPDDSQ